ncbi:response regulator [Anabaena sp. FACHB-709]|uniref:histidine kinase n=2 Tax=Nostocaceae TaxID=1162 RepID=A0A1Z4KNN3_ANAVA|nr:MULTISPECIES: response regulator [Nostocaceae]BAY70483.1 two-component hybrid sensor and regulator [Trichormus variabilis NIES-23]HBW32299.1 hybrid sensor histidine kinase/response regulator [Nostoc sp. UBA8866]MBD2173198.1 hybrid sensor histidine kinase/response regulator [Anabaena cylindrica FACHB-318]MBD2264948.1 hybrid sensor histidine kinase/response regulator [Anabaena sp. FACHB-709]MBD2274258.1 hybrid sensor histidine kinase/response regulator [Nostoc sp. PCC 7120 = FACHB-418]
MSSPINNSVLIVDDIPTNIKVLFDILNQAGFRVSVAKNGLSALAKVQETLPNLILLDVMMPGMDGFETCRHLKANPKTKDIPVIFMTALSDTVNKVKGLQIGAVDYITKPIEYEEVLARINVHLELRRTQLKLAQEEKMSSLGQLVAGIAHEINNPVNFVYGNLAHAQNYVGDLLNLLKLYENHTANPSPEIQEFSKSIELEFIKQDLPHLLSSMQMGTERVEKIVRSLRLFSRLEDLEFQLFNLHEGIDSTLIILSHRLKILPTDSTINIIKEYGDIPLVECYSGKLNQVFMNLLANAIEALEESVINRERTDTLTIGIRTKVTDDQKSVLIEITDNGVGIPLEVQQRIFEQFFTTKPLGKGTGLGLAIAHEIIVEKHGGTLQVQSTPGKGTQFLITIPIQQVIRY